MVEIIINDHHRCEEASILSKETYIPCGRPAVGLVWHQKDGRAYRMCDACLDHNVRNRGGIQVAQMSEWVCVWCGEKKGTNKACSAPDGDGHLFKMRSRQC